VIEIIAGVLLVFVTPSTIEQDWPPRPFALVIVDVERGAVL
jgi:hypothetical protein